jgi:hypothetical protein
VKFALIFFDGAKFLIRHVPDPSMHSLPDSHKFFLEIPRQILNTQSRRSDNLLKVKVSQYNSLTKFDKGKLLALARDRMGFTREQMAGRLRVDWLFLAQLEEGHCVVDEWYLLRAGELTREFERMHQ